MRMVVVVNGETVGSTDEAEWEEEVLLAFRPRAEPWSDGSLIVRTSNLEVEWNGTSHGEGRGIYFDAATVFGPATERLWVGFLHSAPPGDEVSLHSWTLMIGEDGKCGFELPEGAVCDSAQAAEVRFPRALRPSSDLLLRPALLHSSNYMDLFLQYRQHSSGEETQRFTAVPSLVAVMANLSFANDTYNSLLAFPYGIHQIQVELDLESGEGLRVVMPRRWTANFHAALTNSSHTPSPLHWSDDQLRDQTLLLVGGCVDLRALERLEVRTGEFLEGLVRSVRGRLTLVDRPANATLAFLLPLLLSQAACIHLPTEVKVSVEGRGCGADALGYSARLTALPRPEGSTLAVVALEFSFPWHCLKRELEGRVAEFENRRTGAFVFVGGVTLAGGVASVWIFFQLRKPKRGRDRRQRLLEEIEVELAELNKARRPPAAPRPHNTQPHALPQELEQLLDHIRATDHRNRLAAVDEDEDLSVHPGWAEDLIVSPQSRSADPSKRSPNPILYNPSTWAEVSDSDSEGEDLGGQPGRAPLTPQDMANAVRLLYELSPAIYAQYPEFRHLFSPPRQRRRPNELGTDTRASNEEGEEEEEEEVNFPEDAIPLLPEQRQVGLPSHWR